MFYVLQATGGSSDFVMRTTEAQDCLQKHKKVCARSCEPLIVQSLVSSTMFFSTTVLFILSSLEL